MLRYFFLAGVVALIASPALGDPYNDESGKGSYRVYRDRDWLEPDGYEFRHYDIPRGHLPPPGSCRVWFDDRPPGHQPPPTSCREARNLAYRYGGRVIWGGER
ncbi:hypothetical protein J2Z31_000504 [Sinorhizobium kostiense]|uniref:Secreted protein n=1 Tax=Sinorhizobium kostiense TaxID=76747 RepID=A0ABS4QVA9_9HYPH|nr:hypothetical protein [Sinorhizobium kostiense]MBP2234014.1 hypothetical protein [Sinorhizobium kostiense]